MFSHIFFCVLAVSVLIHKTVVSKQHTRIVFFNIVNYNHRNNSKIKDTTAAGYVMRTFTCYNLHSTISCSVITWLIYQRDHIKTFPASSQGLRYWSIAAFLKYITKRSNVYFYRNSSSASLQNVTSFFMSHELVLLFFLVVVPLPLI